MSDLYLTSPCDFARFEREFSVCRWKKVYGGLGVGELRRLKQLEVENRKLKQLIADLSLNKDVLSKIVLTLGRRGELVAYVEASHAVSERRSCWALGVGNRLRQRRTRCDLWISSRTYCSTAGGCGR